MERSNNRRPLLLMQQAIERGQVVSGDGLAKAIRFAMDLIECETATERDRLRASEFLASVVSKGIDVAMYLDKNDRLDSGKATENVHHAVIVKGVDPDTL